MNRPLALSLLFFFGCTDPMAARSGAPGAVDAPPGATAPLSVPSNLDLREANVTAVVFDPRNRRFAVTVLHDDGGEFGFANWWQVETLDGVVLGRHKILSSHGTYPFTTEKEIHLPPAATHVVVRAHDSTHGFGGQAIVYHVLTGTNTPVDQGTEAQSFKDFHPEPSGP